MVKKSGLNKDRGLDTLLSSCDDGLEYAGDISSENLKNIPLDKIIRGTYQPRRHFESESLQELAESIKQQGVLQPIVVRKVGDNFELIAGERRWRAALLAQLPSISAVVKQLDDKSAAAVALIENIQRENLNPLEESQALQRLIKEFDLTHNDVAKAVGRSRTMVTNLLRLLELQDDVKKMVDDGNISMGHARALLSLDSESQLYVAKQIAIKGLSVREAERLVKSMLVPIEKTTTKPQDPNITAVENKIADKLMTTVKVQHSEQGKGKIIINYNSLDELDGILACIE